MATGNQDFNGSSLTWDTGTPADVGPILTIEPSATCAEIDVTDAAATDRSFEAGLPDVTLTCEVLGSPAAPVVGDKGDLALVFNDTGGTLGTITDAVCTRKRISGRIDDRVTATFTFKQGQADAP